MTNEDILDFEKAKEHLIYRLENKEYNKEKLMERPFTPFEDLALTYHVVVTEKNEGLLCTPVTNELIRHWGVKVSDLHEAAKENTSQMMPATINRIEDIIFGADENLTEDVMLVLTNSKNMFGASYMVDPDIQEELANRLGGDYVVLPSSIHEVLCMARRPDVISDDSLQQMVISINQSIVDNDEVLSNNIYQYDSKQHELSKISVVPEQEQELKETQKQNKVH